ncbi:MAG: response regulator [Planctomycetaceae bacterium]|nr:response regulator [Planctomycetaceae bacterium]
MPDIAIIDIGLPGLDGHEVARAVRSDARGAGIKLVALTGSGLPADKLIAIDAGFDEHLTKPLKFDALTRILQSTVPVS